MQPNTSITDDASSHYRQQLGGGAEGGDDRNGAQTSSAGRGASGGTPKKLVKRDRCDSGARDLNDIGRDLSQISVRYLFPFLRRIYKTLCFVLLGNVR